jgi:hypothetical protein
MLRSQAVVPAFPGWRSAQRQGGNGLVFALLGLLVSALAVTAALRTNELQVRRDAGSAEATILEGLRNATNNAIFEQMVEIQNGQPIAKNGVTVTPVMENGQFVWKPGVRDLVGMGYLPPGWSAQTSTLNQAPYTIDFARVPKGCSPAACNIEGQVIIAGAIRSGPGATDGAVIGPILSRLGADAGISLATRPETITGLGNTWQAVNPVNGQPPGVVAARVGTAASGFGQFVRIGDSRDPDLAGDLSVAGNTSFGDGTTVSLFKSTVDVQGTVTAAKGVVSGDGFQTANVDAFRSENPGVIVVKSGDFAVENASRQAALRVSASGDVAALGDVQAGGHVRAQGLTLTGAVEEGDACQAGQVAMLAAGGLATCQSSKFQATTRYAGFGSSCSVAGQMATDPGSGQALVCREGIFASVAGLLSSRVYMSSFSVNHGSVVPTSLALPQGCPALAGQNSQAAIYLLPQTDANTPGNPVLNRDAKWIGNGWSISLTDGAGLPTTSLAIAEVYCVYP